MLFELAPKLVAAVQPAMLAATDILALRVELAGPRAWLPLLEHGESTLLLGPKFRLVPAPAAVVQPAMLAACAILVSRTSRYPFSFAVASSNGVTDPKILLPHVMASSGNSCRCRCRPLLLAGVRRRHRPRASG